MQWKPRHVYKSTLTPPAVTPELPPPLAPNVPMYPSVEDVVSRKSSGMFGDPSPDTLFPAPSSPSDYSPMGPVPTEVPSSPSPASDTTSQMVDDPHPFLSPPSVPSSASPDPVPCAPPRSPLILRQSTRSTKGRYHRPADEGYANVADTSSLVPVLRGVFCSPPRVSSSRSVVDSDGFTLVKRGSHIIKSGHPGFTMVKRGSSVLRVPLPLPVSPLSVAISSDSPGRPVIRASLTPPVVLPRPSDDDHAILDAAILRARDEFLALVAIATDLEPLRLHDDEFILDLPSEAALVSTYDKIPASELLAIPDSTARQIGLHTARHTLSAEKIARTADAEIKKLQRIGGIYETFYPSMADLPQGTHYSQIVNGVFVFKDKADGRETARLAADGSRLPLPYGQISFSAVVPNDDLQFTTAMMIGHVNSRKEQLHFTSCDVVGAFPRVSRPAGSVRIFLRIPVTLPHPYAGGFVEVKGALYGLKESSRLFQLEMIKVMKSANFVSTEHSPMTFLSQHPTDPALKSIASLVVDDILNVDNCPDLTHRLHQVLRDRFTEITTSPECSMFAGIEYDVIVSNGRTSVHRHQSKYIVRTARNIGVTHMPPVRELTMPDFFDASVDPSDLHPVNPDLYNKLVGHLIVLFQTRHEIRPFVSHLSRQTQPNVGDEAKALYLLRYLYSTLEVRCVFDSLSPVFTGTSDAAFAFFENGTSADSSLLSVGKGDGPFYCTAKPQSCVAPDIVAAEYYAVSGLCLAISHFRQLAANLGWTQDPTVIYMDAQSAINLANAPIVTKKARHMKASFHIIREYVQTQIVQLVHVPSADMRVDVLTKLVSRANFFRGRSALLNYAVVCHSRTS